MLSQKVIILQRYKGYTQIWSASEVLKTKRNLSAFILFTNENSDKLDSRVSNCLEKSRLLLSTEVTILFCFPLI